MLDQGRFNGPLSQDKRLSMVLFRRLVIVAALCLFGTSANALTMEECKAKYKADLATKNHSSRSWAEYQVERCGIDPKATAQTPAPAATVKH
jgi:hypothetical protein